MANTATTLEAWLAIASDTSDERDIDISPAAADARFAAFGDNPEAIPTGSYCYSDVLPMGPNANGFPTYHLVPCPFWGGTKTDDNDEAYGYCAKLGIGDGDNNGTMLLWDMCKECGTRMGDTDEDSL